MSVDVAVGRAYIIDDSLSTNSYPVRSTAIENVVINSNASGNPRIDALVLYIDLSASPISDGTGVATLQVVQGTPAASPSAPTNGDISTAIGAANPFIKLAEIAVANGATSIVDANITDTRPSVVMSVPGLVTTTTEKPYALERQALNNGNFDIWQRGTSVTNGSDNTYDLADRWFRNSGAGGGTYPTTIISSRQDLTPGDIPGSYYFYRINPNGAGSGFGATAVYTLRQGIENGVKYLCGAGKKITVSFYARSDIAGKRIGIYLQQYYGSGGSPTSTEDINGTNFTLTSTWTRYTVTLDTLTLAGKTFGTNNDDTLYFFMPVMWGSNRQTLTGSGTDEDFGGSGNIDIAQVQVNAGDTALDFDPKSYGEELVACQRYYFRIVTSPNSGGSSKLGIGQCLSATTAAVTISLPTMRTAPTLADVDTFANYGLVNAGATLSLTVSNITLSRSNPSTADLAVTCASGLTAGNCTRLQQQAGNPFLGFSADI